MFTLQNCTYNQKMLLYRSIVYRRILPVIISILVDCLSFEHYLKLELAPLDGSSDSHEAVLSIVPVVVSHGSDSKMAIDDDFDVVAPKVGHV